MKPGSRGFGPDPDYDLKPVTHWMPSFARSWSTFRPEETAEVPQWNPAFVNKTSAEDLLACVAEAAPRALYHPLAECDPDTIAIPAFSVTRRGPGYFKELPDPIGCEIFVNYRPGDVVFGNLLPSL